MKSWPSQGDWECLSIDCVTWNWFLQWLADLHIYKILITFWKSECSLSKLWNIAENADQKRYSLKCKEILYLQLVSSFPRGLRFPSAGLLPAAAWPDEISVRPGCSLCQCSAYPTKTYKHIFTRYEHKVHTVLMFWNKYLLLTSVL